MGYADLGAYGARDAREGVRFTDFYGLTLNPGPAAARPRRLSGEALARR